MTPVRGCSIIAEARREGVAVDGYAEEQEPGAVATVADAHPQIQGAEHGIRSHEQAAAVLQSAWRDLLSTLPDVAGVESGAEIQATAQSGVQLVGMVGIDEVGVEDVIAA